MSGSQPSAVKAQDPFHGPLTVGGVLQAIVDYLAQQGHTGVVDPLIWCLHLQGELRRLNGKRRSHVGDYLFRLESWTVPGQSLNNPAKAPCHHRWRDPSRLGVHIYPQIS